MARQHAPFIIVLALLIAGGHASAQTAPPIREGAPPLPGSAAVPGQETTPYTAPKSAPAVSLPSPKPAPAMEMAPPEEPEAPQAQMPAKPVLDPAATTFIADLQRALPAHGYRPGPRTGHLDAATESAIQAYQRDAHLPVDVHSLEALKQTVHSVYYAKPPIVAH